MESGESSPSSPMVSVISAYSPNPKTDANMRYCKICKQYFAAQGFHGHLKKCSGDAADKNDELKKEIARLHALIKEHPQHNEGEFVRLAAEAAKANPGPIESAETIPEIESAGEASDGIDSHTEDNTAQSGDPLAQGVMNPAINLQGSDKPTVIPIHTPPAPSNPSFDDQRLKIERQLNGRLDEIAEQQNNSLLDIAQKSDKAIEMAANNARAMEEISRQLGQLNLTAPKPVNPNGLNGTKDQLPQPSTLSLIAPNSGHTSGHNLNVLTWEVTVPGVHLSAMKCDKAKLQYISGILAKVPTFTGKNRQELLNNFPTFERDLTRWLQKAYGQGICTSYLAQEVIVEKSFEGVPSMREHLLSIPYLTLPLLKTELNVKYGCDLANNYRTAHWKLLQATRDKNESCRDFAQRLEIDAQKLRSIALHTGKAQVDDEALIDIFDRGVKLQPAFTVQLRQVKSEMKSMLDVHTWIQKTIPIEEDNVKNKELFVLMTRPPVPPTPPANNGAAGSGNGAAGSGTASATPNSQGNPPEDANPNALNTQGKGGKGNGGKGGGKGGKGGDKKNTFTPSKTAAVGSRWSMTWEEWLAKNKDLVHKPEDNSIPMAQRRHCMSGDRCAKLKMGICWFQHPDTDLAKENKAKGLKIKALADKEGISLA